MNTDATANFWLPLAAARDVGDRPKAFKLDGDTLVAFRDEKGIAVFKDLCVHRGAALSNGWITDGNLTCPYHGWQYDRTGACVAIPSLPPGTPIPAKARAIAYHAREAYDLVWVCRAAEPPVFPEWPDDAWRRQDYRVFMVNEYLWNAAAERVVENALDFSHFNFAHRGFTVLADGPVVREHKVVTRDGTLSYAYEDGRLRRDYRLHFPYVLHDRKCVIEVGADGTWSEDETTRPGDVTIISIIASPLDMTHSRVFAFLSRNHHLDTGDADFAGKFDEVMEQDRLIVESQRPELIPDDIAAELHVRYADVASIAYRRMCQTLGRAVTA